MGDATRFEARGSMIFLIAVLMILEVLELAIFVHIAHLLKQ